ncbi:MAG: Sec-independent protein translocase protein TatB [Gammaproteobacteria bacterium]|nr:Sec-independent protein translocase protein TatB [Gammaproteobacteria bacterium]NND59332.1 twin-arginine translocase subunit TatB [Gammaproteobacteria bacterium]
MFDIGFWEISLIFVLGLLILGPERLPRVARSTGLWLGKARNTMRKLQREIQRELMIEETRAAVDEARRAYDEVKANTIGPVTETQDDTPAPAPTGTNVHQPNPDSDDRNS